MPKIIDLTGKRFGRLIIISRASNDKCHNKRWLCRCDCGRGKIVRCNNLTSGHTKSCGCLNKKIITKHGYSQNNKTYRSWINMIQRCTNPNDQAYNYYGGRGIEVCERWRNSFPNFLEDMDESPGYGYSIEREDNDGNYCPENCIWATHKQQNRNSRNNHLITHNDETQCLIEWSEKFNIKSVTLWTRLYKFGWSIEKALTTPVRRYKKRRK